MKVTVTEALRIKKQISERVQTLQRSFHSVQFGVTKEDNGTVIGEQDGMTFESYLEELRKIFDYSEKINTILAEFSVESGISDAVRHKSNLEVFLSNLTAALEKSVVKKSTAYEIVDQKRVPITRTFVPFQNKSDIKKKIKLVKFEIRQLQSLIDTENSKTIELPFSYEDIDSVESE